MTIKLSDFACSTVAAGGGLVVEFKTASFTAEAGKKYKVDSTAGAVVVTLPAGTNLDNIIIQDTAHYAGTNNITVNPDGAETIDNDTTFVIDQDEGDIDIAYNVGTTDWEVSADGSPDIVYGPADLGIGLETKYFDVATGAIVPWNTPAKTSQAPSVNNTLPYEYIAFDGASQELASIKWRSPKRWNAGTIRARFIWKDTSAAASLTTIWAMAGVCFSDGDNQATAVGTAASITDTTQTDAKKIYVSGWTAAITLAGTVVKGGLVDLQIYRDGAADSLNSDARLLGVEIEYTTDAATDD